MAVVHLLGTMAFAKNSITPNTVKLNPRRFNSKGKANRAPNVLIRFLQFVSDQTKIGFFPSSSFLKLVTMRFTMEAIASREAARKEIRPPPGLLKLPKDTLTEEIIITPATNNQKMLLI